MIGYLKEVWRTIYSHLLFFYAGALIFMQLDIWYWTPKDGITPATFTAGASTITLFLAFFALAKVNKWHDDKIKEKKFEKAHYFFEKLSILYVSVARLNAVITNLPTEKKLMKTSLFLTEFEEIKELRKKSVDDIIEVASLEKHFEAMDIVFNYSDELDAYLNDCVYITKEARTFITFLDNREFPDGGRISDEYELKFEQEVTKSLENIKNRYSNCTEKGEAFLKIKFGSMFELVKK